jgi:hypothetical protein
MKNSTNIENAIENIIKNLLQNDFNIPLSLVQLSDETLRGVQESDYGILNSIIEKKILSLNLSKNKDKISYLLNFVIRTIRLKKSRKKFIPKKLNKLIRVLPLEALDYQTQVDRKS